MGIGNQVSRRKANEPTTGVTMFDYPAHDDRVPQEFIRSSDIAFVYQGSNTRTTDTFIGYFFKRNSTKLDLTSLGISSQEGAVTHPIAPKAKIRTNDQSLNREVFMEAIHEIFSVHGGHVRCKMNHDIVGDIAVFFSKGQ